MYKFRKALSAIALLCSISTSSFAGIMFSTLESGFSAESPAWTLGGANGQTSIAFGFIPSFSGYVTSIEAAIGFVNDNPITSSVFSINLGFGVLETFTLTPDERFPGASIQTAAASGSTFLTVGQNYFLVGTGDFWNTWARADPGYDAGYFISEDGFETFEALQGPVAAFRINGEEAEVPAPATLALFGLGLAGLGWSRRKKS